MPLPPELQRVHLTSQCDSDVFNSSGHSRQFVFQHNNRPVPVTMLLAVPAVPLLHCLDRPCQYQCNNVMRDLHNWRTILNKLWGTNFFEVKTRHVGVA